MTDAGGEQDSGTTLIAGGTVITLEGELSADVLIEDGVIRAIGHGLGPADRVIDVSGRLLLPGGVDEHTHYGSFGGAGFETSAGSLAGGTTTVIDFVPQQKGEGLREAARRHASAAAEQSRVDYALHSMVMDAREDVLDEVAELPQEGISSVKLFTAYKGTPYHSDDAAILRAMKAARGVGVTVMIYAENADINEFLDEELIDEGRTAPRFQAEAQPPLSEEEAVARVLKLAEVSDCPVFFVHVSTTGALDSLRRARVHGQRAAAETCTHYLVLTKEALAAPGTEGAQYVCSPPLRGPEHRQALWSALGRDELSAVGSDHCAVLGGYHAKVGGHSDFTGIPNGCPGVEYRLQLLWTYGVRAGRITPAQFVDCFASGPARNFNLPGKGCLAPGYDADLVVFDPDASDTVSVDSSWEGTDFSIYDGMHLEGRIEKVLLRGRVVVDGGEVSARPGQGRRITSEPYGATYGVAAGSRRWTGAVDATGPRARRRGGPGARR